jgi:hypothetical protein
LTGTGVSRCLSRCPVALQSRIQFIRIDRQRLREAGTTGFGVQVKQCK